MLRRLSCILSLVFVTGSYATEEMAKREKATCISCHRTAKGGRPGNSMLSPRGFNYLRGLIQSEAYVPLYNYQELQLLNAKIAENKRVQDGGAPMVQPAPESSEAPAQTLMVEESQPESVPTPEPLESQPMESKPIEAKPMEPEPTRVSPAQIVDPKPVPELKPSQMAVTPPKPQPTPQTTPTKTVPPVNLIQAPVTAQPVPVVQTLTESKALPIEADGTVILPRPKPLLYYSWREDWEYDDYF